MSQRSVVIGLLREGGSKGVLVHDLIYRHGITRAAAIVYDLKQPPPEGPGMDIVTMDEGIGRLARYVLREPQTIKTAPPAGLFDESLPLPPPKEIVFDCGCVRADDGRSWRSRCEKHSGLTPVSPTQKEVGW